MGATHFVVYFNCTVLLLWMVILINPSNFRYADIYTSRVSNFLHYTPFMYFRSQEQVLEFVTLFIALAFELS